MDIYILTDNNSEQKLKKAQITWDKNQSGKVMKILAYHEKISLKFVISPYHKKEHESWKRPGCWFGIRFGFSQYISKSVNLTLDLHLEAL